MDDTKAIHLLEGYTSNYAFLQLCGLGPRVVNHRHEKAIDKINGSWHTSVFPTSKACTPNERTLSTADSPYTSAWTLREEMILLSATL